MEEEKEKDISEVMDEVVEERPLDMARGREGLEGDEGIEGIEGIEEREEGENDDGGLVEEGTDLKPQIDFKKAMSVAGILIFGFLIIFLGMARIKNLIGSPFLGYGESNPNLQMHPNATNSTNDANMLGRDTDKDGLNDYEETYTYKTSVYIKDTDSDGVSDFEEVSTGEDPLCPGDSDCYGDIGEKRKEKGEIEGDANVDLEEVRRLLIEGGADEEAVRSVDDETLMQMYWETVEETGIDPLMATNGETNGDELRMDTNSTNSGSGEVSAAEIRRSLLGAGVDEATVNSVDDETLVQMYLEAVREVGE